MYKIVYYEEFKKILKIYIIKTSPDSSYTRLIKR